MSHQGKLSKFENNNVYHFHLVVPKAIANEFIDGDNRRVLATLNNDTTIHAGLMHLGNGDYYINLNKEVRKKLNLQLGDTLSYSLAKDNSEYGMPMCEELKEVLDTDYNGFELFKNLTMGKQRSLIYICNLPKGQATRIKKSLVLMDCLKASKKGDIDYKLFNNMYRNSSY